LFFRSRPFFPSCSRSFALHFPFLSFSLLYILFINTITI
jgi:hypothetical protein